MESQNQLLIDESFREVASKVIQNSKIRFRNGIYHLNEAEPQNNANSIYESQELINMAGESFAFSAELGLKSNLIYDDFRRSIYFSQLVSTTLNLGNKQIIVPAVGDIEWHRALAASSSIREMNIIKDPKEIRKTIILENDSRDERAKLETDSTFNGDFLTLTYDGSKTSGHSLYSYYQLQEPIAKSLINIEYYCYVEDEIKYTIYALLTEDILNKNSDGKTIMPKSFMENLDSVKNAAVDLRYSSISFEGLGVGEDGHRKELEFLEQFASTIVNVGEYRFPIPKAYAQIDFEKYKFENFFANNIAAFQNLDKMTKYYLQSCFTKKEIESFIKYININPMDSLTLNLFVNNAIYLKNFVKNRMQMDLEFTEKQFARVSLICDLLKAFQPFDSNAKRLCDNEFFATEEKKQIWIEKTKKAMLLEKEEIKKEKIDLLKKKYPNYFAPSILSIRSEKEIAEFLLSEEFKHHPKLFTPYVLKYYDLEKVREIITSEEFKQYPELFTPDVLTHYNLERTKKILSSEEFKHHPELFTLYSLPTYDLEEMKELISSEEFKNHSYLFTTTILASTTPERICEIIRSEAFKARPELFSVSEVEKYGIEKIYNEALELLQIKKKHEHASTIKTRKDNANGDYTITLEEKIKIFIEMLNKGNSNVLRLHNQEILEGEPSINLSYFWAAYKQKIKEKLFEELKDNPEYELARQTVLIYFKVDNYEELNMLLQKRSFTKKMSAEISMEEKIEIFIEMLNKGNREILKAHSQETLDGYPNIKLANFWQYHREKIKKILFGELIDDPNYEPARQLINAYEIENDNDEKIKIFIEMLNKGNREILRHGNQETLDGYPNIKLANFWQYHREKIKEKLFVELKGNPEYEAARKTILNFYKVNDYEELENLMQRGRKLKEVRDTKQEIKGTIISLDEYRKGKGK